MKAAVIHGYGEQVRIEDVPRPAPGEGDLLVQVRAASVNPVDFKIRDGKLKALVKDRMPLILGQDLSGTVVESRGSRFKAGDEIYARLDKDRIGAFAEYALVRESAAAPKPATLSHVEAASIPLVGLTAWQAMIDIAHLQRGQRVLIHAGSGGVGTFAIQLAKHLGAWVATTVGARNVELVQRLGADQAIDYRAARFDEVLKDLDFVLDTQGGETLWRSFSTVKRGGTVVSIGGIPDLKFARAWGVNPLLWLPLAFLTRKETGLARRRGVRYEYLFMKANGEELGQIGKLIDSGILKPVLDRTFKLDEIAEALAYSESGRATGKVVVEIG
jgi:NADPH:quinone reductase-like Zn-dependent oxidoreductase